MISLSYRHGCGDASNFAHAIPLWLRRGHEIAIATSYDKQCLFSAAGAGITVGATLTHPYFHPPKGKPTMFNDWCENKTAHNITTGPLPRIGSMEELWSELLDVKLSLAPFLSSASKQQIDDYLATLPTDQIICLHTQGNTGKGNKNCSAQLEREIYRELLAQTDATILLLDWDNRVARMNNCRVRHMLQDFKRLELPELWYLIERSALMVGVDSGPLHFTRFTSTPSVGIWFQNHPAKFALPRPNTVHLVDDRHGEWNSRRRHSYNLVTGPVNASSIAQAARSMLAGRLGADLAVEGVLSRIRCDGQDGNFHDRDATFREALKIIGKKAEPLIVETGCVRSVDDWTAGFSTYVFGLWLKNHGGGRLLSFDHSAQNCAFAREWCAPFPVKVVEGDSVDSLLSLKKERIDLALLDSMDTTVPGHEEHCLEEAFAVVSLMADDGLILIDDTPYTGNHFSGKGALAVPFLLDRGWKILPCSGYQVLLQKDHG